MGGEYMMIAAEMISDWSGTELDPTGNNLDTIIVHEIDHHLDFMGSTVGPKQHLLENGAENPQHTMHSKQCGPEPTI